VHEPTIFMSFMKRKNIFDYYFRLNQKNTKLPTQAVRNFIFLTTFSILIYEYVWRPHWFFQYFSKLRNEKTVWA